MAGTIAHQVIQANVAGFTGSTKTVPASVAGTTLFLVMTNQAAASMGTTAIVDSALNVWTKLANTTAGTGRYVELWVARNAASITSVTTSNTTSSTAGYSYFEPGGCLLGSAADDGHALNQANTTFGPSSCSLTPATANDFIIAGIHWNTFTTSVITQSTAGYSTTGLTPEVNGNFATASALPASATSVAWSATGGTGQGYGAWALALKVASPPPSTGAILLSTR
jgi:hypothetical protein